MARSNKELDYYDLTKGVDPRPIIMFYSAITPTAAMKFNKDIARLIHDFTDHEDKEKPEKLDIRIHFQSFGGHSLSGIAMYNTIKVLHDKANFTGINDGIVGSAAVLPYLACQTRLAMPQSLFLLHPNTWHSNEAEKMSREDINTRSFNMEMVSNIYDSIILGETNIDPEEYENIKKDDKYSTLDDLKDLEFFQGFMDDNDTD